ncbi:hypothetical protein C7H84_18310 [Burkholderia sp. Nafp2/4-1b]|nr:hypothetical protein C7H84_18310 [Burkholderia sp. Nafp2/4-1b]
MGAHVLETALKLGCREAHRFTVHVAIRCVALPEKGKPCARMRAADVRPSLLRRRAAGARRAAEAASLHLPVQNSMGQKCKRRESDFG